MSLFLRWCASVEPDKSPAVPHAIDLPEPDRVHSEVPCPSRCETRREKAACGLAEGARAAATRLHHIFFATFSIPKTVKGSRDTLQSGGGDACGGGGRRVWGRREPSARVEAVGFHFGWRRS